LPFSHFSSVAQAEKSKTDLSVTNYLPVIGHFGFHENWIWSVIERNLGYGIVAIPIENHLAAPQDLRPAI
jgi:hypothetical protein